MKSGLAKEAAVRRKQASSKAQVGEKCRQMSRQKSSRCRARPSRPRSPWKYH